MSSYAKQPKFQISKEKEYLFLLITSGGKYSAVPTNSAVIYLSSALSIFAKP